MNVKADKNTTFAVTIRKTDTIITLRKVVAEKYGRPPSHIRLFLGSQELKGDKTLQEAKITDGSQVVSRAKSINDVKKEQSKEDKFIESVEEISFRSLLTEILQLQLQGLGLDSSVVSQILHSNEEKPAGPSVRDQYHPGIILAAPANFERIFKLLDLVSPIASDIWDLLQLIPPNSEMNKKLEDLASLEQNLDTHLNTPVILKLAYSLAVISTSVQGAKAPGAWCDKFLELDGINRLLSTLARLELERTGAYLTCCTKLLRLINFFIAYELEHKQTNSLKSIKKKQLKQFISQVLSISLTLNNGEVHLDHSSSIVKHAVRFVTYCILAQHSLLSFLYGLPLTKTWLQFLLLESPVTKVRKAASLGLITFCKSISSEKKDVASPSTFFLNLLLTYLDVVEGFSKSSENFFLAVESLLASADTNSEWGFTLLLKLIDSLNQHPILEASESADSVDCGLIGIFNLIRIILMNSPQYKLVAVQQYDLLTECLLKNCLFAIPTADNHGPDAPPKCKTKESRYAAYRLLVELCKQVPENFIALTTNILQTMNRGKKIDFINFPSFISIFY